MFQKRHYEWIAARFAGMRGMVEEADRRQLARDFARGFERENPRFDRGRFLAACVVPE